MRQNRLVDDDLEELTPVDRRYSSWYVLTETHDYTIFVPEHIEGENDNMHFAEDFSTDSHLARRAALIHELSHLHQHNDPNWKHASGGSVKELGLKAYGYRTATGRLMHDDFWDYTEEQQAEILSDLYRLENGGEPGFNRCRVNPAWPCNKPSGSTIDQMKNELTGLRNIPRGEN